MATRRKLVDWMRSSVNERCSAELTTMIIARKTPKRWISWLLGEKRLIKDATIKHSSMEAAASQVSTLETAGDSIKKGWQRARIPYSTPVTTYRGINRCCNSWHRRLLKPVPKALRLPPNQENIELFLNLSLIYQVAVTLSKLTLSRIEKKSLG